MTKLLFSLGLIMGGLALGYILQILNQKGALRLPLPVPALRKLLQKAGLLFFMPISFVGAVWIIRIDDIRIITLPFLCLLALALGGVLALGGARIMGLGKKQTGAYFACGSFSNLGSIGALVAFVFLGEEGFAIVPLYKLFEQSFYYTVGFPITKYYSTDDTEKEKLLSRLKEVFADIFVLTALGAVILGAILNVAGLERPVFFGKVTSIFVPVGTFILLVSIGLAMRFSSIRDYFKESLLIAAIKFAVIPLIIGTIASLLGFANIDHGLPLKVVLIVSSMPVAFTALVPPSIYDLDINLANACWLTTTLALVIVIPWLYLLTIIL